MICFFQNRLGLSLASALVLLAITVASAKAANNADTTGWLLMQNHSANGHQKVYVFPQKLRVENTGMGNALIADEQTGKVWVINDSRKLACCVNWDQYEHSFSKIMQVGGENVSKLNWKPAKDPDHTVVAGFTTHCFKVSDDKLYFKGGGGGFMSGGSRKVLVDYTVYVADKIAISPRLRRVLAQLQTLPTLDGVPVKAIHAKQGRTSVDLETMSAKQIPNDKNLWQIPKYKQVARPADVTNMTDQGFIEDLLGKP